MNERHVTAVVLLSGATTAGTHDALHAALTAQTRLPDRVVVAVPSDLDEDVRAALESLTASGEVDRLVDVPARPAPARPRRAGPRAGGRRPRAPPRPASSIRTRNACGSWRTLAETFSASAGLAMLVSASGTPK